MATPLKTNLKKPLQDLPPPGGYPGLDLNKRLPGPRISGLGIFAIAGAMISFGFYRVIEFNTHQRELAQEKREMRATLIPYLQAEEDMRYLKRIGEVNEIKQRIMGSDWVEKPIFNDPTTWTPPAYNRVG